MFYGGESNVPGAPGNLLAGNPLMDPRFKIPGTRSGGQPVLPGENKKDIEDVYGRPGMKQMPGFSPFQLPSAMGGASPVGNLSGLVAQINPTYPVGDPKYGNPMMGLGNIPMSLNAGEYEWSQRMNRLREQNPGAYQKIKGMMGPYGWTKPPAGFQVPPGI
jgi:hypothetical protein